MNQVPITVPSFPTSSSSDSIAGSDAGAESSEGDDFSMDLESSQPKVLMSNDMISCKCRFCGKRFRSEVLMEKHIVLKHKDECSTDEDSDIFVDGEGSKPGQFSAEDERPKSSRTSVPKDSDCSGKRSKSAGKRCKTKKPKQTRNCKSKLVKSLQEDELLNMKLFAENIEIKENFFFCKNCKFSTTTQTRAQTHAVTCRKTRKKGRPVKVSLCLECDQKFSKHKDLLHHNREHFSKSYTCSICLKVTTRRHSYLRHLKSHKEPPKLQCTLCPKTFRYNSNLNRHIKTHMKPLNDHLEQSVKPGDNMINFEVDLEEKRIQEDYCGKFSVKELADPNVNFHSLGFAE